MGNSTPYIYGNTGFTLLKSILESNERVDFLFMGSREMEKHRAKNSSTDSDDTDRKYPGWASFFLNQIVDATSKKIYASPVFGGYSNTRGGFNLVGWEYNTCPEDISGYVDTTVGFEVNTAPLFPDVNYTSNVLATGVSVETNQWLGLSWNGYRGQSPPAGLLGSSNVGGTSTTDAELISFAVDGNDPNTVSHNYLYDSDILNFTLAPVDANFFSQSSSIAVKPVDVGNGSEPGHKSQLYCRDRAGISPTTSQNLILNDDSILSIKEIKFPSDILIPLEREKYSSSAIVSTHVHTSLLGIPTLSFDGILIEDWVANSTHVHEIAVGAPAPDTLETSDALSYEVDTGAHLVYGIPSSPLGSAGYSLQDKTRLKAAVFGLLDVSPTVTPQQAFDNQVGQTQEESLFYTDRVLPLAESLGWVNQWHVDLEAPLPKNRRLLPFSGLPCASLGQKTNNILAIGGDESQLTAFLGELEALNDSGSLGDMKLDISRAGMELTDTYYTQGPLIFSHRSLKSNVVFNNGLMLRLPPEVHDFNPHATSDQTSNFAGTHETVSEREQTAKDFYIKFNPTLASYKYDSSSGVVSDETLYDNWTSSNALRYVTRTSRNLTDFNTSINSSLGLRVSTQAPILSVFGIDTQTNVTDISNQWKEFLPASTELVAATLTNTSDYFFTLPIDTTAISGITWGTDDVGFSFSGARLVSVAGSAPNPSSDRLRFLSQPINVWSHFVVDESITNGVSGTFLALWDDIRLADLAYGLSGTGSLPVSPVNSSSELSFTSGTNILLDSPQSGALASFASVVSDARERQLDFGSVQGRANLVFVVEMSSLNTLLGSAYSKTHIGTYLPNLVSLLHGIVLRSSVDVTTDRIVFLFVDSPSTLDMDGNKWIQKTDTTTCPLFDDYVDEVPTTLSTIPTVETNSDRKSFFLAANEDQWLFNEGGGLLTPQLAVPDLPISVEYDDGTITGTISHTLTDRHTDTSYPDDVHLATLSKPGKAVNDIRKHIVYAQTSSLNGQITDDWVKDKTRTKLGSITTLASASVLAKWAYLTVDLLLGTEPTETRVYPKYVKMLTDSNFRADPWSGEALLDLVQTRDDVTLTKDQMFGNLNPEDGPSGQTNFPDTTFKSWRKKKL